MIMQVLHGPTCQGTNIIRHGQTRQAVLAVLNREPVEVAIWRAEERELLSRIDIDLLQLDLRSL